MGQVFRLGVRMAALASILAVAALSGAGPADAAWTCRKVQGKRTCGLEPTVPRQSAVPTPGVSPSVLPPPNQAKSNLAKDCKAQGGHRTCR